MLSLADWRGDTLDQLKNLLDTITELAPELSRILSLAELGIHVATDMSNLIDVEREQMAPSVPRARAAAGGA